MSDKPKTTLQLAEEAIKIGAELLRQRDALESDRDYYQRQYSEMSRAYNAKSTECDELRKQIAAFRESLNDGGAR